MVYHNWGEVIANVKKRPAIQRVAVAAAQDEHALEAVFQAQKDGLVSPILIGDKAAIVQLIQKLGGTVAEENIYDEPDVNAAAALAVHLIKEGNADFLMKGKLETGELLRAVVHKETGLGLGGVMSHFAIQELPSYHKMLVTTDGGMLVYPTLEQKKELIQNAVNMLLALGYTMPKVAVLAGVEKVNPKMPETVDAAALKEMNAKGEITGCVVEGPISLDLALVAERSAAKGYSSPVAGDADILVSPNLCTSNILGKSLVEMAGAKMAGLILGAQVPVVVTSRGSSALEKHLSLVLAAASCA